MDQQTYVQPDLWPNIQQDEQTTRRTDNKTNRQQDEHTTRLKDEQRNGQPDNWTNRQMVRKQQVIQAKTDETGQPLSLSEADDTN